MAVTTATLPISIADITQVFGTWKDCSTRSWATKLTRYYESRHNTLFGRGMSEEETMLSLQCVLGVHDRAKTSIHRTTIQGGRV